MDKQNVANIHNGLLLSLEQEGNLLIGYNMDEPWRHHVKRWSLQHTHFWGTHSKYSCLGAGCVRGAVGGYWGRVSATLLRQTKCLPCLSFLLGRWVSSERNPPILAPSGQAERPLSSAKGSLSLFCSKLTHAYSQRGLGPELCTQCAPPASCGCVNENQNQI